MAGKLRVAIEAGPKGKKVVAVARDWPGLSRGAVSEELALERLRSYVPRYRAVAAWAGLQLGEGEFEVVERYTGTGSTDFWGISFGFSEHDRQRPATVDLERELTLMQACWAVFDEVRGRVTAELRKGPRGGGRDRDRIVHHVLANEHDWARKVGLKSADGPPESPDAVAAHRERYCAAIGGFHREGREAGAWPLRFLVRHTAFHTMDHTWEMEDRDLPSA